ncbi:MAG: tryptophan--tRNA ligase [Candidatus Diapherotrites archaeon]
MELNPWSSKGISDYEHVFKEFGLNEFPEEWKKSLKHYFFERNIVIAHRGFELVMKRIEEKKPFINMTGIASSGPLHFGHKADIDLFVFFKSLGAHNHFCIADIDGYASREKIATMDEAKKIAVENLAHALALGLDEKDVYVQSQMNPRYYEFVFEISKKITNNMFEAVYGHVDLGKVSAAILQYADILHPQLKEWNGRMPSVTGIGLDQDPHARLTRDIAKRLPYPLEMPSFIYFKHQSGLTEESKMSSSAPETAIFLSDSEKEVKKKISNAFTGGRETVELQKKLGGNPEICKVCEILRFHYPNTREVERIMAECKSGKRLCGETKQFTIEFLNKFLKEHQARTEKNRKKAEKIVYGK